MFDAARLCFIITVIYIHCRNLFANIDPSGLAGRFFM